MDRRALADYLRARRQALQPEDLGLSPGLRRRTPGLRREEVAELASISPDYYARIEQARGPHPSREVLVAVARALLLDEPARRHLLTLAGLAAPDGARMVTHVSPAIIRLLRRLDRATAAIVCDATQEVIAWNDLALALLDDFPSHSDRSLPRRLFLWGQPHERHFGMNLEERYERFIVARLRRAAARYPEDQRVTRLLDELRASERFRTLWDAQVDQGAGHGLVKRLTHPVVGRLELSCDTLEVPEVDQDLVIFSADPVSPSHRALEVLATVGRQRLSTPADA